MKKINPPISDEDKKRLDDACQAAIGYVGTTEASKYIYDIFDVLMTSDMRSQCLHTISTVLNSRLKQWGITEWQESIASLHTAAVFTDVVSLCNRMFESYSMSLQRNRIRAMQDRVNESILIAFIYGVMLCVKKYRDYRTLYRMYVATDLFPSYGFL